MSSRGVIVPEIAERLRAIAARVADGTATKVDVHDLKELAQQLDGSHPRLALKAHLKKGAPSKFYQRLEMARAIERHIAQYNVTPAEARRHLAGTLGNVGDERLRQVWAEFEPVFRLDENNQRLVLWFKALEAKGIGKVTRLPSKKK